MTFYRKTEEEPGLADPALIHYREMLPLTFSPQPRCTRTPQAALQADGRCAALSPQAVPRTALPGGAAVLPAARTAGSRHDP